MKKFNKLILTVLAVFALALVIKMPAQAAIWQTGCSENRIGLAWDDEREGGQYSIYGYALTGSSEAPSSYNLSANTLSTVINAPTNYTGKVYLHFLWKSRNGSTWYHDSVSTSVCAQPYSITSKAAFGISYASSYGNTIEVGAKRPSTNHGIIVELFKGNRRLGVYSSSYESAYSPYLTVAKNCVYQYRVKYWTEIYTNGRWVKYYSRNWSPVRKFVLNSTITFRSRSNVKGFKLSVPKASGVSSYSVYVSKSANSGYKKVKTIKPGKKNVAIKKNYKKRGYTYVRVVPNIPGYGASDIYSKGSIYTYK